MTDKTLDDRLDRLRAHQWANTAAIGVVLVVVISLTVPTTITSLVAMGAGFLVVLLGLFEISRMLGGEADVEATDEAADGAPAEAADHQEGDAAA